MSVCDNSLEKMKHTKIRPQCNKAIAIWKCILFADSGSKEYFLCNDCKKHLKKGAESYGYRVEVKDLDSF